MPQVAEAVGEPLRAIKLLHGDAELDPEVSLAAAGVVDGTSLTCVVRAVWPEGAVFRIDSAGSVQANGYYKENGKNAEPRQQTQYCKVDDEQIQIWYYWHDSSRRDGGGTFSWRCGRGDWNYTQLLLYETSPRFSWLAFEGALSEGLKVAGAGIAPTPAFVRQD